MTAKVFHCKQFSIAQSPHVFKITSDSLMLGAWANINSHSNVIEVGTGTGIISLMLVQKAPSTNILAIDKNQDAVGLARTNFENSPWSEQLTSTYQDFRNLPKESLAQKFQHIISNPPFFKDGLLSVSKVNQNSRHTVGLELHELIEQSSILLKPKGTIQLIVPFDRMEELRVILKKNHLHLIRLITVKATSDKAAYRILVEIGRHNAEEQSSSLIMYDSEGKYSTAYKELLTDYMKIF